MRKVFGKIWLVWSAFFFCLSWPFMWIAYQVLFSFYKGESQYIPCFKLTRAWGRYILFVLGVRVKEFGKPKIDTNEQHIYVCNHQSQIDIPVNFVSNPQLFVILSKKEVEKMPAIGLLLKKTHVTVNRKSAEDRKLAMKQMNEHLKAGRSLLIYPEGRRNRTDEPMGRFKTGAFQLAIQNQVPIVPVTILGSEQINNPVHPLSVNPGTVKIFYDNPIETHGFSKTDLPRLIKETREKMLTHFAPHSEG